MKHSQKILGDIWKELELSLENSKHPFHIFTITTINGNFPDSRYVVLRNVNETKKTIYFNTDKRSNKIKHIKNNNNVCALFYDIVKKIQLRIYGSIKEETNLNIGAVGADGSARGAVAGGLEYVGVCAFDALPGVGCRELEYLEDFPTGSQGARSFGWSI